MKKYISLIIALAVVFSGLTASGADVNQDKQLYIESEVSFAFNAQGQQLSAENLNAQPTLITFVNLNADSSYFFLDDINNSDLAESLGARIIAVDVNGEEDEALAITRESLATQASTKVELVSDPDLTKTAQAFAKEAGVEHDKLSYPFTVILSPDKKLSFAFEGYRKPDLLKDYILKLIPAKPTLFAYGFDDSVKLFWSQDKKAQSYQIFKGSQSDEYNEIFSTTDVTQTVFTDKIIECTEKCVYYLKVNYINSSVGTPPTPLIDSEDYHENQFADFSVSVKTKPTWMESSK